MRKAAQCSVAIAALALTLAGCAGPSGSPGATPSSATSSGAAPRPSTVPAADDGAKLPQIPGYAYTATPAGMAKIGTSLAAKPHALQVLTAGVTAAGTGATTGAVVVAFFDQQADDVWSKQPDGLVAGSAVTESAMNLGSTNSPTQQKMGKYTVEVVDLGGSALVGAYVGNGVLIQIAGEDLASTTAFAEKFLAVS